MISSRRISSLDPLTSPKSSPSSFIKAKPTEGWLGWAQHQRYHSLLSPEKPGSEREGSRFPVCSSWLVSADFHSLNHNPAFRPCDWKNGLDNEAQKGVEGGLHFNMSGQKRDKTSLSLEIFEEKWMVGPKKEEGKWVVLTGSLVDVNKLYHFIWSWILLSDLRVFLGLHSQVLGFQCWEAGGQSGEKYRILLAPLSFLWKGDENHLEMLGYSSLMICRPTLMHKPGTVWI